MQLNDSFVLDGVRRTSDGYLAAFARVARTGIQTYRGSELGRPDLDMVRVYRPAEEVFSADALRSFAHRPVTLRHPNVPVTSKNWKKYAGGQTGDEVVRDGDFVRVPMVMMDQALIDAYERDGIKELSMGYSTDIQWRAGVTDAGEPYDAVQTAIRGNHLAVVPVARGGDQLRIGDEDIDDDEFYDELNEVGDGFDPNEPRDKFGKWTSGGNADEDQTKALSWFKKEGYAPINKALRSGKTTPKIKDAVKHIDAALAASSTTKNLTVYRGESGTTVDPSQFKVGNIITMPGYVSTTKSKDVAGEFASSESQTSKGGKGSVTYKIDVPKGSNALALKGEQEQELLLPRGSKFKIVKVEGGAGHDLSAHEDAYSTAYKKLVALSSNASENIGLPQLKSKPGKEKEFAAQYKQTIAAGRRAESASSVDENNYIVHMKLVRSTKDSVSLTIDELPEDWKTTTNDEGDYPMKLVIDGINVNVADDQSGAIIERHIASLSQKLSDAAADLENFKKKKKDDEEQLEDAKKTISAKDGEIAVLKKQVEDAKVTPEKLDALVKDRLAVVDKARPMLDKSYSFDGKTVEQVRKDAVTAKLGDAVVKHMNDAAIEGAFAALTPETGKNGGASQIGDALRNRPHTVVADDRTTAYDEMVKRQESAWKTPSAA